MTDYRNRRLLQVLCFLLFVIGATFITSITIRGSPLDRKELFTAGVVLLAISVLMPFVFYCARYNICFINNPG